MKGWEHTLTPDPSPVTLRERGEQRAALRLPDAIDVVLAPTFCTSLNPLGADVLLRATCTAPRREKSEGRGCPAPHRPIDRRRPVAGSSARLTRQHGCRTPYGGGWGWGERNTPHITLDRSESHTSSTPLHHAVSLPPLSSLLSPIFYILFPTRSLPQHAYHAD